MNVNFPTRMIVNVTLVIKKDFFPRINKNQLKFLTEAEIILGTYGVQKPR